MCSYKSILCGFENLVLNLWAQSIECIGSCTEIVPIARACMYYFHAGSLR